MPSNAAAAAALAARKDEAMSGLIDAARGDEAGETAQPPIPSSEPPVAAAPAEAQEAAPPVDDDYDFGEPVPDELALELDIDLDEEVDEEEPAPAAQYDDDDDEYVDPEIKALRARAAKAEKEAARLKAQNAKANQKLWAKEATKYFPLSSPESITATSHRGFLREAKRQHEQMLPVAKKIQERERARIRKEVEEKWGPAVSSAGAPQPSTQALDQRIAAARPKGVRHVFREMVRDEFKQK